MYDWSVARRMVPDGACAAEIAAAMGCPRGTVYHWARKAGVTLRRENVAGSSFPERDVRMAEMYRQGVTLENIGQQFRITRERVRQVMKRMGLVAAGEKARAAAAAVKVKQKRRTFEARIYAQWGVEPELWRELRANGTLTAYTYQKRNAKMRAIDWKLTFADWYSIWQTSGKLHLRGRGKNCYCMSRIRDDGIYELGNVHVQTNTANGREAVEKWRGKTKAHRGVYLLYPGREMAWHARVGKVRLGFFSSAEAATVARNAYISAKAA